MFYGFRSVGQENIPRAGPVLFASNHVTYYDPVLVAIGQDEAMNFLAWDALFKVEPFGWLIRIFGAYPVSIERGGVGAYRATLHVLRQGGRVLIFPEAGRSDDGGLMEMREGVAHLALRAGAPIVPVRIEGAYRVWPKGQRLPHFHRPILVTYGKPITLAAARTTEVTGKDEQEAATAEIMRQLREFLAAPAERKIEDAA
ncbi:MAG: 1-acyl-sn-glycerol-3-phosphate acyltransferase [bacterium]|nr:1-acyl-sn-glycerol-3-phosphate acyltransferase [bacterium]